MARLYLDSSALAKRYLEEAGTARVLELFNTDHHLITSRLTQVEVTSAAVRRGRAGEIPDDLLRDVLVPLDDDLRAALEVSPLSESTLIRSTDVARGHGLRAADAVQLACCLTARSSGEVTLVSSDEELNTAARAEGLTVINPLDEAEASS